MLISNNKHIINQYDIEFKSIIQALKQMYLMTEQQIQDALTALIHEDFELANSIAKKDKLINNIQIEIHNSCNVIIMKRQPTASDLRLVFSIFSVTFEIERIADSARKLAKLTLFKCPDPSSFKPILQLIEKITSLSLIIFNQTIQAFVEMDLNEATRLHPSNRDLIELTKITEKQIIRAIEQNKVTPKQGIDIFNTARSLGKINSKCQNICELVIYYHLGINVRYKSTNTIIDLVNQSIELQMKTD